jgi:hypothetical protein
MRKLKSQVTVIVEKTRDGYSAYAEKDPVFTTGTTITELERNMVEARNLYLGDNKPPIKASDLKMQMALDQFIRSYRVINTKLLANRIGMNESLLSQYAHGLKKPSAKQVHRILAGIREIGKELSEIEFLI